MPFRNEKRSGEVPCRGKNTSYHISRVGFWGFCDPSVGLSVGLFSLVEREVVSKVRLSKKVSKVPCDVM